MQRYTIKAEKLLFTGFLKKDLLPLHMESLQLDKSKQAATNS